MMSCLNASRGYRLDPQKTRLGNSSSSCAKKFLVASSQATTTTVTAATGASCSSSLLSDTKSSISSGGSESTSSHLVLTKKPRTRRRRPQEIYNEAAAALSAIYPKVFSAPHQKKNVEKFGHRHKIGESLDDAELLQEVPTLIRRARGIEEIELLYNQGGGGPVEFESGDSNNQVPNLSMAKDSPASSESKSQVEVPSPSPCASPSWDDSSSIEYEYCLLDSKDGEIDGSIMSSIMGDSSADPDFSMEVKGGWRICGGAAEHGEEQRLQCSAIRSLRRTSDCFSGPVLDYPFQKLRFSDKIMAEKEKNCMSFCSLDWLKADAASQRLKLKLNYEDVLNAWSDRGPLYTDDVQNPPMGFVDSSCGSMGANLWYDWIPDMSFWKSGIEENGMYGQTEDRSSVGEDGMLCGSGIREASVLRYKEKRRTRLFSKKIRYEVRKLNAERRPRMKGRFVRRLSDL
eukprot:TRINITY_DN12580_c0_g1_i1.p1 TRINITY_DN12580_c0_g1~~TRINITY_DN12580_c0_g1_i1.p1  ORF type:complete len:458 (+),score=68.89 TRINITY_DN12580_c0_g1_i1:622-1995(+)